MSKRKYDSQSNSSMTYTSFDEILGLEAAGFAVLPPLPGQFPGTAIIVDAEETAVPSQTFQTTAKLFSVNGALAYVASTFAWASSIFKRRQTIVAEPVASPSGSRKKILLDAGLAGETRKTSNGSKANQLAMARVATSATHLKRNPNPLRFNTAPGTIRPLAERTRPSTSSTHNASKHNVSQRNVPKNNPTTTNLLKSKAPTKTGATISTTHLTARASAFTKARDTTSALRHLTHTPKATSIGRNSPSPVPPFLHMEAQLARQNRNIDELPDFPPVSSTPARRRKESHTSIDITLHRSDIDIYHDNIVAELEKNLRQELKGLPTISREEIFTNAFPKTLSLGVTEEDILRARLSDAVINDLSEQIRNRLEITIAEEEAAQALAPTMDVEQLPEPLLKPLLEEEIEKINATIKKTNSGLRDVSLARSLKTRDMATLLPTLFNGNERAWLNDQIVNDYLEILVNHEKAKVGFQHRRGGDPPPVHAFPSQLWTNLYRGSSVSNWAMRKQLDGEKFLQAKLILVPLCHGNHWRLFAIKPQERAVEYLDSLDHYQGKYETLSSVIFRWIKSELGDSYVETEWKFQTGRSRVQKNGSDCGVFTCLNALAYLRGDAPERVEPVEGMMDARKRIAITLLNGKTNELD
ncbi:cysteine proteinase [Amniculicola lignicola CBS 123094]|uniref:Cysteine proteinase n=1 Tax=Amniculicola lignicola CBS 123094 TaxID=1392246 RepID=A0A6A5VWP1_9PLEO|nr:cysteine proteinase [Amniculicola lignicola CBS 123094]